MRRWLTTLFESSVQPLLLVRAQRRSGKITALPSHDQWEPVPRVCGLLLAALLSTSCGRAPSFDVLGSFFPAWLACLALALLLTVAARWLFLRLHIVIVLPILTYPSLAALLTFALWLVFFR
jgi:YtcA family